MQPGDASGIQTGSAPRMPPRPQGDASGIQTGSAPRMPPRPQGHTSRKLLVDQPPHPKGNQNDPESPNTLTSKKCCGTRTEKKGDRGFIEGCLFALCCCWLCEACF